MATSKGIQFTSRPALKKVIDRFDKRLKKLKNKKLAFKKIAIILDRWVQQNFRTEGGNVGGWEEFAYGGRLTTKKKAKAQSIEGRKYIDPSAKLLQDTGRLKASFLPFATNSNAGIGSDLKYSKKHDEGEDKLPVRRMLPKGSDVALKTRIILDKHVKESLK